VQLNLSASPQFVSASGERVTLAARDGALLAWLALEGPTPRLRIAQLLWPESDTGAARNALRQRLHHLRKQCGVVLVEGQAVLALHGDVTHDLDEADGVLGDQAEGFGPELAAWITHQRQRRQSRVRQALVELADMAEGAGDHDDALSHARELLAYEPLSEEAHRRVMRLHYLRGDRAAALQAFDVCERVLKDEVGARPAPETLALLADVEASALVKGAAPRVLPASLLRPPHAAGREDELATLLGAWRAGQAFVLLGEAGMGKTRLLERVADEWPGVLRVQGRPGDGRVPLALVARLVEALCAREPAWRERPGVQALRQLLLDAAPSDLTRPMPQPLLPWLCELLEMAMHATPPWALVFDDWQFADEASVVLLAEVLQLPALAGLRHGHASRTAAGPVAQQRVEVLRQDSTRRVVSLAPLSVDAVAALVDSLQLRGGDAPALAQALQRRVGGNPLYVLEVLRHMHERGLPLQPQQVLAPQHVKALVTSRLAEADEGSRRLLRIAAVAGGDFSPELAEVVSGQHLLDLSDAWGTLERLGLFDSRGIAHDLYAEAVLEALPATIGRVLHGRIAAWLETRECNPARLAAHWRAAGEDHRAEPHLLAAAHQAWHAALAQEVFDLYQQAIDIALARGDRDLAFDHGFNNADAMSEIGSAALFGRCVEVVRPLVRTERQALRIRLLDAVHRWMEGPVESALRQLEALIGDAIALGDARVEGEARFAAASRAGYDGRFDDALQQLAAAERVLRDLGDTRRATALAASMAMILGLRGQAGLALREQQRLLPDVWRCGDLATWTVLRAASAQQLLRQGNADGALAAAHEALATARSASIAAPDTAVAFRYLVDTLRWSGRFDLALTVFQEFSERLQRLGDPRRLHLTATGLHLHVGRADLARPLLQSARELLGAQRLSREQLRMRLLEIELACHAGAAVPDTSWTVEALDGEDLPLACEWALWSGLQPVSPWPADVLVALHLRCDAAGLTQLEPAVAALAAWRSAQAGTRATRCALLSPQTVPSLRALGPWAALFGARAHALAGEMPAALALAQAGVRWLRACAQTGLPDAFRDSFLHRHPVHRTLQAEATRLGASPG
jgi:DNA-binding SARP family transcriptional activator